MKQSQCQSSKQYIINTSVSQNTSALMRVMHAASYNSEDEKKRID